MIDNKQDPLNFCDSLFVLPGLILVVNSLNHENVISPINSNQHVWIRTLYPMYVLCKLMYTHYVQLLLHMLRRMLLCSHLAHILHVDIINNNWYLFTVVALVLDSKGILRLLFFWGIINKLKVKEAEA